MFEKGVKVTNLPSSLACVITHARLVKVKIHQLAQQVLKKEEKFKSSGDLIYGVKFQMIYLCGENSITG